MPWRLVPAAPWPARRRSAIRLARASSSAARSLGARSAPGSASTSSTADAAQDRRPAALATRAHQPVGGSRAPSPAPPLTRVDRRSAGYAVFGSTVHGTGSRRARRRKTKYQGHAAPSGVTPRRRAGTRGRRWPRPIAHDIRPAARSAWSSEQIVRARRARRRRARRHALSAAPSFRPARSGRAGVHRRAAGHRAPVGPLSSRTWSR